jgi:transposase
MWLHYLGHFSLKSLKRPEISNMTTKTKESYTAEFRENAVKRANESSNIAETARELGIKENTLYNWVHKYTRPIEPTKASRTDEHLYDELKRLKKEVARLKEERDILKKAAAYFAKDTR